MNPVSTETGRVLFVTGRLAEHSLRQVLDDLAPSLPFRPEVLVLPISVAALMSPKWVARKLEVPEGISRVVLPGHCRGDLSAVVEKAAVPVELGPVDLRDLPRYLGQADGRLDRYGSFDIEILAEVNHAPSRPWEEVLAEAVRHIRDGADRIDLGCDPGGPWPGVGPAVKALVERGYRVSIDSFDVIEIGQAVAAGAGLVLSVNAQNRQAAVDWGVEVVAIPDTPGTLDGLDETVEFLDGKGIRFRLDPILEPIGFGFAASLGRYLETRRRYPGAAMMMGVGNLTELTDVDSAGINMMLIGFCQELKIFSVLTTAVINWARSSVREIDLARRLARFAVIEHALPKRVDPGLVMLRDPRVPTHGPESLAEIAARIKDPNWRIFAESGRIHAMNHQIYEQSADPFVLFSKMGIVDAAHAFYLGYEMAKAKTALTLDKAYRQDQALDWGFLTEPEVSHRERSERETS